MFQKLIALPTVLLLVLALSGAAQAQESGRTSASGITKADVMMFLSGSMTKKESKQFAEKLGVEIVLAAHPTGSNPDLRDYGARWVGARKLELTLRVEYFGGFTGRLYPATASLVIDLSDPKNITVEDLRFTDTVNSIPSNKQNLAQLRKAINKLLED